MALEFQNVDVKFTGGADTKNEEKIVVPGKWLELQNVSLAVDGTFKRRDGTDIINGTAGNGLVLRGDQLAILNAGGAATVDLTGEQATISGRMGACEVSKTQAVRTQGYQDQCDVATNGTVSVYVWRDLDASAAVQSVSVQVIDERTGALLIPATAMKSTTGGNAPSIPRVVYCSNLSAFIVIYRQGVPANLFARVIQTGTPTVLGTETSIFASANLGTHWDMAADATGAVVHYRWTDGVTSTRALVLTQVAGVPAILLGPTNVTTEAALPTATVSGLAVGTFLSGTIGCFVLSTGGGGLAGVCSTTLSDATLAILAGPTQIDATVNPTAGDSHIACVPTPTLSRMVIVTDQFSNYGTARLNTVRFMMISSANAVVTAATDAIRSNSFRVNAAEASGPQGPWIAGKPFISSNSVYVPMSILENHTGLGANVVTNNQQNSLYVVELSQDLGVSVSSLRPAPVLRCLTGSYGAAFFSYTPQAATVCSTPILATTPASSTSTTAQFAFLAQEFTRLVLSGMLNVSPTGIVRLTFSPRHATPPIKKQLGPVAHLSGGVLTEFDGPSLNESGFHLYPEGVSCVGNAAGGSVSVGVHQVVVVYEWVDGQGQRHQSAPSGAVSITSAGANPSITVQIPTLRLTQRFVVSLVPYMTAAGGLTFYRCTLNGASLIPLANDTTVTAATFTITQADATLTGNEALYTQPNFSGGTLPNTAPPPCNALTSHQNRLWCNVADDTGAYRYSQSIVNATGLQWNDALGGRVDVNAGGIVAFAELDEKLIILCERRLYLVTGTGPNTAGVNSQYSDPIEIQSDSGCVEARSVVSMPRGIMFKGAKGWRLLGRDLQVVDISEGPWQFNNQSVTSAVLMSDRDEVRFSSNDTLAAQLVYCYRGEGQWSWSYVSAGAYTPADAIFWPARQQATKNGTSPFANPNGYGYVHVAPSGGFNGDSASQFDSNQIAPDVPIHTHMISSWLKLNSMDGFQRVRWLYLTMNCRPEGGVGGAIDSTLAVALSFDDSGFETAQTAPNTYTFSVPMSTFATSAIRASGIVDLRHKMKHQKCKSVQIIIDESNYGTSALIGYQALTLNLGMKRGTNKLPGAQGAG